MGKPAIEMEGLLIGQWKVLGRTIKPKGGHSKSVFWVCRCSCGRIVSVSGQSLRSGESTQCRTCANSKIKRQHGLSRTRLYHIWTSMLSRCYSAKADNFHWYGGRGIKVCPEWKNDFLHFKVWADKSGYADTLTLDRIENNGDYTPENCRWISHKQQMQNTRISIRVDVDKSRKTLSEWAEQSGLSYALLYSRLKRGWQGNQLFLPVGERRV